VKSVYSLMVLSYAVWLLLGHQLTAEFLISGLVVSVALSLGLARYAGGFDLRTFTSARRCVFLARYFLVLVEDVVKAGLSLSRIVLRRHISVQPGVVAIRLPAGNRWALTVFANSITLTPGTFFLDTNEDGSVIFVHLISAGREDIEEWKAEMKKRYAELVEGATK